MKHSFLIGLGSGVLATLAVVAGLAFTRTPAMMLPEHRSRFSVEETVQRLSAAAQSSGWVVSSVADMQQSVAKHGGSPIRPVRLVNLCQAHHASRILSEDTARRVAVLMPCTIAVYEKSDGSVWVATMNPRLMAPLFGGVVAEVMGGAVARDQAAFVQSVAQR